MTPGRSVFLIYYFAMGLVYIALGICIFVFRERFADLGVALNIMAGSCIVYGAFRLSRAWVDYRRAQRDDRPDNLRRHPGV